MNQFEKYQLELREHPNNRNAGDIQYFEYEFLEPISGYRCKLFREGFYRAYVMLPEEHLMYNENEKYKLLETHYDIGTCGSAGVGIDFAHNSDYIPSLHTIVTKWNTPERLLTLHYWNFEDVKLEITRLAVQLRYIK